MQTGTEMLTAPPKGARTCVGCHEVGDRASFVRLVLSPVEASDRPNAPGAEVGAERESGTAPATVVVDAAGGAFGRGVHVHPRPKCIELAAKSGLSRSLRTPVKVDPRALAAEIATAMERRALGLLGSAKRARKVAIGADATVDALRGNMDSEREGGPALAPGVFIVVATDAAHAATLTAVSMAIKEGRAAAWLDRASLGAVFDRNEVAVCAVLDERIGRELIDACNARASVLSFGEESRGEACRSREVR